MKNNKLIQGYFLLDKVEMTEEYEQQLNQLKKDYLIEWNELKEINGRSLYLGVLRDESKLYDSVDELGTTKYGLLTIMKSRNVNVIGIWNLDGTELGTQKIITPAVYSEEGELIEEEIIEIVGESKYPFNKSLYLDHVEPRIHYDEDGNELSREEFYDLVSFSGFKPKIDFEVNK